MPGDCDAGLGILLGARSGVSPDPSERALASGDVNRILKVPIQAPLDDGEAVGERPVVQRPHGARSATEGPLFRRITPGGCVLADALQPEAIAAIV